jgi:hypothetical protein
MLVPDPSQPDQIFQQKSIFWKVLARLYFSITGQSIDKGRGRKKREKHFLFPTQEMGAKTPRNAFCKK